MRVVLLLSFITTLIPSCLCVWECTYVGEFGIETTKTCSSGCCEHDCCPFDGKLFGAIFGSVTVFAILVACCAVYIRRRSRQARAAVILMGGPAQTAVTTTISAGAPVPEHRGYDQSNYQPSRINAPPSYA